MTINIYLSQTTLDRLNDMRKKYHVSISTIAQILSDYIRPNINNYPAEFLMTYIDKEHRLKTSIKPNNLKETEDFFKKIQFSKETASHIYSNVLYIYAKEDFNYLFQGATEKECKKWAKEIENELIKRKDIYYNYNNNIRNTLRIIRKNQEYFKKVIGAN